MTLQGTGIPDGATSDDSLHPHQKPINSRAGFRWEESGNLVFALPEASPSDGRLEGRGSSSTLTSLDNRKDALPDESRYILATANNENNTMSIARKLSESLGVTTLRYNENLHWQERTVANVDFDFAPSLAIRNSRAAVAAAVLSLPSGIESLSYFLEMEKVALDAEESSTKQKDNDELSFQSFDSVKYYRRRPP